MMGRKRGAAVLSLVIGNCVSAAASVFLAISSCARSRKTIYLFQLLETATFCVSSVFFASWAGVSTLLVSLARNVLVVKNRFREWHVYLFSALVVLLGLYVNNRGALGLLPIAATVEITFANYYAKSVALIKASVLLNTVLWAVYSCLIWDFAAGISEILISILGAASLIQYMRQSRGIS